MPQLVNEVGSPKWRKSWIKLPKNSLAYAAKVEYPTTLTKDELINIIEKQQLENNSEVKNKL